MPIVVESVPHDRSRRASPVHPGPALATTVVPRVGPAKAGPAKVVPATAPPSRRDSPSREGQAVPASRPSRASPPGSRSPASPVVRGPRPGARQLEAYVVAGPPAHDPPTRVPDGRSEDADRTPGGPNRPPDDLQSAHGSRHETLRHHPRRPTPRRPRRRGPGGPRRPGRRGVG